MIRKIDAFRRDVFCYADPLSGVRFSGDPLRLFWLGFAPLVAVQIAFIAGVTQYISYNWISPFVSLCVLGLFAATKDGRILLFAPFLQKTSPRSALRMMLGLCAVFLVASFIADFVLYDVILELIRSHLQWESSISEQGTYFFYFAQEPLTAVFYSYAVPRGVPHAPWPVLAFATFFLWMPAEFLKLLVCVKLLPFILMERGWSRTSTLAVSVVAYAATNVALGVSNLILLGVITGLAAALLYQRVGQIRYIIGMQILANLFSQVFLSVYYFLVFPIWQRFL